MYMYGDVYSADGVVIGSTNNGGSCGDPAGTVDESNLVLDDGDEWMRFVDDSDPDTGNSGRPLRLRGGGQPLVAEPAEPDADGKFDAEFDVKAWQHYGGVWYTT
jgi:hypothetical protein